MRRLISGFAVAAFFAFAPSGADAQVQLGPTLAFSDEVDFGIGATLSAQAPQLGEGIGFLGEFIFYFPDNVDFFEINGNVTYAFPLAESTVLPFALGGLNIGRISSDFGGGNTDVGVNLGGGISFDLGSFRPSVGGRFVLGDFDHFILFATLPFEVGSGG